MLTPLGFRLTIDANEFKNLEYFCIAASLPSVQLPAIPTGFRNSKLQVPGETISYDPMSVTFIVDAKLLNYQELFSWILTNANGPKLIWRDMTLSILTNQNTSNKQVKFKDVIPTALTALEFNIQTTDVEYLAATVEFAYTAFEIVTVL